VSIEPGAFCEGLVAVILFQEARAGTHESWQFGSKLYKVAHQLSFLALHLWPVQRTSRNAIGLCLYDLMTAASLKEILGGKADGGTPPKCPP
jgi:hypothetical protein